MKSCHGSGKSYSASIVIAWWVDTRIDMDAIVVSTAPTYEQVNKILWEYLRALMTKFDPKTGQAYLPGKITMEDEWKDGGRVVAFGRKPSDTNLHGFQGIHRRQGVLAVLDEACGIPESLWTGVETVTTGIHDRILAIANPDDPNTELGRIFANPDSGWHKITISWFDTPNYTGEWVPEEVAEALISAEWVEEKRKQWGEDSPRYQSKILGEFPGQGVNTLFPQVTLARGIDTQITVPEGVRPRLGVDVARFGNDYTVIYRYDAGKVRLVDRWAKADTVETAQRVHAIAVRLNAHEVRVDGVGVGAGVWDMLGRFAKDRTDGHEYYKVVGMVGNAASPDNHVWVNARAFWYDTMREKMHQGRLDIDFEDRQLKEELEGLEYKFGKSYGALQIESKDDMIARGVKSPDYADAAMYACADLPLDPENPISAAPLGSTVELALEDLLMAEDMQISPY